jgi:hypothetical protein
MVQGMGSECRGFNLLHINGPMYGVWVLGIQPFTYEWSNVWGLSAGDSTVYIWMVQCMGSECWRFNRLHMNGPMYGVWVLGDSTFYIWMVQCMGSEHWGFKLLHINDPIYGVWVLGIQPFTYEWSNVWGLSAGDPTFYILMIQWIWSECWVFNPLHINGPMYEVWVLGIQPSCWIPSTQTTYIGPLICRKLDPQHADPIHWTINM